MGLKNKRSCSVDDFEGPEVKKRKIVDGECLTSSFLSETGSKESVVVEEPIANSMETKKLKKQKSLNKEMKNTESETTKKKKQVSEVSAGQSAAINNSVVLNDTNKLEVTTTDSKIKKLRKSKASRTETGKDDNPVAANQSAVLTSSIAVQSTNKETGNAVVKAKKLKKPKTVRNSVVNNEAAALDISGYNDSVVLENTDDREVTSTVVVETQEAVEPIVKDLRKAKGNKQKRSQTQNSAKNNARRKKRPLSSEIISETTEPVTTTVGDSMNVGRGEQELNLSSRRRPAKKLSSYTASSKSFPLVTKPNDYCKGNRLKVFTDYNVVSYSFWKKICVQLDEQGIKYGKSRFTEEENRQLKKNWFRLTKKCPFPEPIILVMGSAAPASLRMDVSSYIKETNFYIELGHDINRPLYDVYIRARKVFNPGNYKGKYTKEEEQVMKRHVEEHGHHWQKIGSFMGRSGQSLIDHYKRVDSQKKNERWSKAEDELMRAAIKDQLDDSENVNEAYFNLPWTEIAQSVKTHSAYQCRERWLWLLAFHKKGNLEFGRDKQIRLIKEIQHQNVNHESEIDWLLVKSKFDVPTPQFLQTRWRKLKLKVPYFQRYTLNEVLENLLIQLTEQKKKKQDAYATDEEVEDVDLQTVLDALPTYEETDDNTSSLPPVADTSSPNTLNNDAADVSMELTQVENSLLTADMLAGDIGAVSVPLTPPEASSSQPNKKQKHKKRKAETFDTSVGDIGDVEVPLTPQEVSLPKKKKKQRQENNRPNADMSKDVGVRLTLTETSTPKNKKPKESNLSNTSMSNGDFVDISLLLTPSEMSETKNTQKKHKHEESSLSNSITTGGGIGDASVLMTPSENSQTKKKQKKHKHEESKAESFDASVGDVDVQLTLPETSPQKKKSKKRIERAAEC